MDDARYDDDANAPKSEHAFLCDSNDLTEFSVSKFRIFSPNVEFHCERPHQFFAHSMTKNNKMFSISMRSVLLPLLSFCERERLCQETEVVVLRLMSI